MSRIDGAKVAGTGGEQQQRQVEIVAGHLLVGQWRNNGVEWWDIAENVWLLLER